VLPEKVGRISETALAAVDSLYSSTAAETRAAIVLGLVRKMPSGAFNSSRLYSADGKLEANYDKHHLLPGVEPEKPGDKRVVLDEPSGRWGLQICKDMDFPKLSREYAAEGATLARSARNGLLTLSDNRGRILAESETVPDRFVSITGKVNVSREQTFYARTGDWFAWLCVAVFVSLLAFQRLAASHAGEKRHA
jgi:apolipoprotein N-acyltransferase